MYRKKIPFHGRGASVILKFNMNERMYEWTVDRGWTLPIFCTKYGIWKLTIPLITHVLSSIKVKSIVIMNYLITGMKRISLLQDIKIIANLFHNLDIYNNLREIVIKRFLFEINTICTHSRQTNSSNWVNFETFSIILSDNDVQPMLELYSKMLLTKFLYVWNKGFSWPELRCSYSEEYF